MNINKFIKIEIFCNCNQFCLIFFIFSMITFFHVLASVAANHKITEAEVLNKIAGLLKYAPNKIGVGVVER